MLRTIGCAVLCGSILALGGCGKKKPPALTEVEGVVMINGVPLPHATVTLMPELKDFVELHSVAVTDENGRFKMESFGKPGAYVGKNRVLVAEGPMPANLRNQEAQGEQAQYLKALKNRPIPDQYGNLAQSTIYVEVKGDQKEYVIQLSR